MANDIEKLNIAVDFLIEGRSFKVGQFVLYRHENTIVVNGYSNYRFTTNITKEIAIKEFAQVKEDFNKLMEDAKIFIHYSKNKKIEFALLADYGNGAVLICKEVDGIIEFSPPWFVSPGNYIPVRPC